MLFVFGKGSQGQLGTGDLEDQLDPILIEGFRGSIVGASGGENHTLICNDFGDVYSYGRGRQGQHGNGSKSTKSLCLPEQVLPLQPERVIKVACGANHCLAVTVEGELYQWGSMSRFLENQEDYFGSKVKMPGMTDWNKTRQDLVRESHEQYYRAALGSEEKDVVSLTSEVANFGTFSSFHQTTPKLIATFADDKVVDVDGGYSFSVALTESGKLYAWGFNEKRQLGLAHRFNQETPVLIPHLAHIKIVKVKCGQQHSLALSEDGHVYSWGLGVLGQLGHGECRDAGVPTKIEDIPLIQDIACGSHHSLLLDREGRVFTFGSSEYGQQAGSTQHVDWQTGFHHSFGKRRYYYAVPRLIEHAFGKEKIISIACGDLHNIGLTESGDVYTWGWGAHGALGHGDRNFQSFPKKIVRLHGERVARVSAGSHATYVITENSESNFAFDFKVLVNSPNYSDVTFVVKNRDILAHKSIVCSRSAYLRKIVDKAFAEGSNKITIDNVDHAVFLSVIKFIYTDHLIQTPMHHVPRIRDVAIQYGLGRLVSICNQMMKRPIQEGLQTETKKKVINFGNSFRIGSDNMFITVGYTNVEKSTETTQFIKTCSASTFTPDMIALVNSPSYSDITFTLDDGSAFYCHKSILCARSDYFQTIFDAKYKESSNSKIHLPEISHETFGNVLSFIYANEIKIDLDNKTNDIKGRFKIDNDIIVDVLLIAGRFLLTDLKQRIEKELEKRVDLDIVMDIVLLSEMATALKLKKACLNYFAEHLSKLQGTEDYKQFSKDVNVETMQSIHFLHHKKNMLEVK